MQSPRSLTASSGDHLFTLHVGSRPSCTDLPANAGQVYLTTLSPSMPHYENYVRVRACASGRHETPSASSSQAEVTYCYESPQRLLSNINSVESFFLRIKGPAASLDEQSLRETFGQVDSIRSIAYAQPRSLSGQASHCHLEYANLAAAQTAATKFNGRLVLGGVWSVKLLNDTCTLPDYTSWGQLLEKDERLAERCTAKSGPQGVYFAKVDVSGLRCFTLQFWLADLLRPEYGVEAIRFDITMDDETQDLTCTRTRRGLLRESPFCTEEIPLHKDHGLIKIFLSPQDDWQRPLPRIAFVLEYSTQHFRSHTWRATSRSSSLTERAPAQEVMRVSNMPGGPSYSLRDTSRLPTCIETCNGADGQGAQALVPSGVPCAADLRNDVPCVHPPRREEKLGKYSTGPEEEAQTHWSKRLPLHSQVEAERAALTKPSASHARESSEEGEVSNDGSSRVFEPCTRFQTPKSTEKIAHPSSHLDARPARSDAQVQRSISPEKVAKVAARAQVVEVIDTITSTESERQRQLREQNEKLRQDIQELKLRREVSRGQKGAELGGALHLDDAPRTALIQKEQLTTELSKETRQSRGFDATSSTPPKLLRRKRDYDARSVSEISHARRSASAEAMAGRDHHRPGPDPASHRPRDVQTDRAIQRRESARFEPLSPGGFIRPEGGETGKARRRQAWDRHTPEWRHDTGATMDEVDRYGYDSRDRCRDSAPEAEDPRMYRRRNGREDWTNYRPRSRSPIRQSHRMRNAC
ncbi:hypothetical protein IE81DRAFT_325711 [Ceraceosorus guamensis]|uniref:RRM domain-containing protein n=1 Tax=Ceraceosorus guamensis TaxID=1522189 RepID=A0A316VSF0_9BASI|nr:hypothetical protein IE81DRAFT_325711 [Ceraceosorus guamensis]PWN40290.1 hypothetical protein IE81DRAFT_325711 [Ceraceosorus guamensis]